MFWGRRAAPKAQKSDVSRQSLEAQLAATSQAGSSAASPVGDLKAEDPGLLTPTQYSCPGNGGFKSAAHHISRGDLQDRQKVSAAEPQFRLASVHLVEVPKPTFDIAGLLPNIRDSTAEFTFVLQLMVPGPPHLALTMSWSGALLSASPLAAAPLGTGAGSPSAPAVSSNSPASPFQQLLGSFVEGDGPEADKRRHEVFKLIPSVVQSSWIIKQAVGQKPVLLGQKLTTKYSRGPGYFEMDVDVGSSRSAATAVGLVSGATKGMVIDMGVLLEGKTLEQLPEQLLGTVRFSHLDMKQAPFFDTQTGVMHPPRRA